MLKSYCCFEDTTLNNYTINHCKIRVFFSNSFVCDIELSSARQGILIPHIKKVVSLEIKMSVYPIRIVLAYRLKTVFLEEEDFVMSCGLVLIYYRPCSSPCPCCAHSFSSRPSPHLVTSVSALGLRSHICIHEYIQIYVRAHDNFSNLPLFPQATNQS